MNLLYVILILMVCSWVFFAVPVAPAADGGWDTAAPPTGAPGASWE